MLTVAFGDRPAQYILECSKEEVSNYARDVMKDEKLANDILTKSYVDDTAISLEKLSEADLCSISHRTDRNLIQLAAEGLTGRLRMRYMKKET